VEAIRDERAVRLHLLNFTLQGGYGFELVAVVRLVTRHQSFYETWSTISGGAQRYPYLSKAMYRYNYAVRKLVDLGWTVLVEHTEAQ
jgi:hypothetical protein